VSEPAPPGRDESHVRRVRRRRKRRTNSAPTRSLTVRGRDLVWLLVAVIIGAGITLFVLHNELTRAGP
jgi:hypothetical protein